MDREQIAAVCHNANRALREQLGEDPGPTWEEAPEDLRRSTRAGVDHALDSPDANPRSQHESWMRERLADGWTYDSSLPFGKKDADAKRHSCLVEYDVLPIPQRAKDHLFLAVARSLAAVV